MLSATAARCRVCGDEHGDLLWTVDDVSYFRCQGCRALQKQLSESDYLDLQPGYDPGDYLEGESDQAIRAFLKVPMKRRFLLSMLERGGGRSPAGMDFLDVGCGMGGYMLAAQDLGMNVLGFEPSPTHGKIAKERFGLDVRSEFFSSDSMRGRQFDFIMLSHVIEHIYEPRVMVHDLVEVLKPDGVLVIITPNAGSVTARLSGRHWPMLVPLDHVSMLSVRSMSHIVPPNCIVEADTSEYPSEFLATLASVAKARIRGRDVNYADRAAETAPKVMQQATWRGRLLRCALTVGSFPFYVIARRTDTAAALRVLVRKQPEGRSVEALTL